MLAIGTRLGPYEILAPLGQGGMGEVYRARDIRLDRDVAVKVVPEGFARDADRLVRFEREAKAVAALAHPNILVLYDIGCEQGMPFAVTELLDGSTLRGRLAGASLPWREAVELGAAVAAGLAAAHAKGIIHRDIKPENLFVTHEGRLKILDFGLARLENPAADSGRTQPHGAGETMPGNVVGTVGYMSPEQLRGLPLDGRSDLFSLGCVLYEALTGQKPFRGRTPVEVAVAILHDEPPPLSRLAPETPGEVEQAVARCLAKEASDRYPAARELGLALQAILHGSEATLSLPAPRRRKLPRGRETIGSLAVLPLANASLDPDAEYLSDGITESLINLLSQLPGLRVMARSTVFRYKGSEIDVREIGRTLKVRAVLAGQLIQRQDRLIVKAELVDAADGSQLWSGKYDRPFSEIPILEQAIAHEIAENLRPRLTRDQKRRLDRPQTKNPEAYQCYLQGRRHWNKRTAEGLKKSIQLFEKAIDLDPTYALAFVGMADAYVNLGGWGYLPFREAYPRAKAAALRALALDDDLAEAHVSLGMVHKEYDWDWPSAGREYRRALELNPNYAVAHQWYGEYLACMGQFPEAIASFQRAIELDPLSLIMRATLGRHGYYFARQYDQAIAELRKILELDEDFWVAHHFLSLAYAQAGQLQEALAEAEAARRLDDNREIVMVLGYIYGLAGRRPEAHEALEELQQLSQNQHVSAMFRALVAIGLGEHERALDYLDQACVERAQMLSELKVEAAFDPLRSHPRFVDLLRKVGLESRS
ncbi:MAG: protein kinase [Planctomycetes bacterium]|nr:protein kinase [Planctomycetota bacterium]